MGVLFAFNFAQADESKGAGVVIITSIMRGKLERDSSTPFKCPSLFQDQQDLYSLDLPRHPSISFNNTRVMTKTAPDKSCITEKVEDILARHSCLKNHLDRSIKKAENLIEEWQESYLHLVRKDQYSGNIDPREISYRMVIRSSDENISFIDLYTWDFSWLIGLNPFSRSNTCPYTFHLQQEWTSKDGQKKLINSIPLDQSV